MAHIAEGLPNTSFQMGGAPQGETVRNRSYSQVVGYLRWDVGAGNKLWPSARTASCLHH